jgi:uncharacterized protein (TIGR02145 family)
MNYRLDSLNRAYLYNRDSSSKLISNLEQQLNILSKEIKTLKERIQNLEAMTEKNDKEISVSIGDQLWMGENLNVSTFRNGDTIKEARTEIEWRKAGVNKEPAWCYYDNDPKNGEKYGKLYNWYAISDPRGLAPTGWHIPSDQEWDVLFWFLKGDTVEYSLMSTPEESVIDRIRKEPESVGLQKIKHSYGWVEGCNGTNDFGFSAIPGGHRLYNGDFSYIGVYGYWWTSSSSIATLGAEDQFDNQWEIGSCITLGCHNSRSSFRWSGIKEGGLSIRCVKD